MAKKNKQTQQEFQHSPVAIVADIQESINNEIKLVKKEETAVKQEQKEIMCPKCRCVKVEVSQGQFCNVASYRCGMCGFNYEINTDTQEYLYA